MHSSISRSARRPHLRVGILRSLGDIEANVWSVVDALRSINQIAQERHRVMPVAWGWLDVPEPPSGPGTCTSAADKRLSWADADVVVIPGWLTSTGPKLRQASNAVCRNVASLIRTHVERGASVLSLFNGSALLADCGLLGGRKAAMPWAFAASIALLSDASIDWQRDRSWYADGNIWTTAALSSTLEALFDALKHSAVADIAQAVGPVLLFDLQRQMGATASVVSPTSKPLTSGSLELARKWLQTHSAQPYDLAATARAAATSPRTLLRWFSRAYGQTPLDYLHSLRIGQAQTLLQTTYLTVETIAHKCGYTDVGSFRKLFVRISGMTPSAFRQKYQLRTDRRMWSGASDVARW